MKLVPRYDEYRASSRTAAEIKRRVRHKDTKAELALRRALWAHGLRYRLHAQDLPGQPDIIFRRKKVAVFCDGDFWHGRDWPSLRAKLARRANPDYWIAKIGSNIERDVRISRELRSLGWRVIRLWETDILRQPEEAVAVVADALRSNREKPGSVAET